MKNHKTLEKIYNLLAWHSKNIVTYIVITLAEV